MQANVWQFEQAGAALVQNVREFSEPEAGRIIVRNYAIGINPVDWKFIDDNPRDWEKGHIPGVDGAGVVVAVGEGVDDGLLGRRVAYHHSLGENGSFADHSEVYASRVMVVPESVDFALAAALPCPMLTAWQAFSKVPVRKGADVLVSGMGAVNKLLAQMLSQAGFSVHVISGSFSQEQADEMGVKAIHRGKPEGQTFYALFDANGPDYAASLVPLLEANGHVVSILGRIEVPVDAPFTRTISYHEIALGALHDYGDLSQWQRLVKDGEALLEQVAAQTLVVEIPNLFEFNDLNNALRFSKEDKRKAVITVL
ncbi:alcohol dehydrogenase catalytic domain-containing protein [Alteromonas sp. IB21]|uniref:alcohol dehydrogenase catalytic domain-containing protein n=1 Tax=Alteromonas sp. IB21 TaxID=2779369 RepID=UPI0018E89F75|nr:alcohol dehydrogenase catalytic domain-containing protein [Alteromonas sp. IB21]MBJ2127484.1 alcohol dehydrogenase catalytic domain-containing protein [Alteromonas sp. IB21]